MFVWRLVKLCRLVLIIRKVNIFSSNFFRPRSQLWAEPRSNEASLSNGSSRNCLWYRSNRLQSCNGKLRADFYLRFVFSFHFHPDFLKLLPLSLRQGCMPYPYGDPYYNGLMTAYGPTPIVSFFTLNLIKLHLFLCFLFPYIHHI